MAIMETAQKKMGPFPVWIWLAGGVIVLVFVLKKKQAANAGSLTNPQSATALDNGVSLPYFTSTTYVNITNPAPKAPGGPGRKPPKPPHKPGIEHGKPPRRTHSTTYTVHAGDTLSEIAGKYLGNPTQFRQILSANKAMITRTAQSHGRTKAEAQTGNYIYPGERLTIPANG